MQAWVSCSGSVTTACGPPALRTTDREADALANGNTHDVNPGLRIHSDPRRRSTGTSSPEALEMGRTAEFGSPLFRRVIPSAVGRGGERNCGPNLSDTSAVTAVTAVVDCE